MSTSVWSDALATPFERTAFDWGPRVEGKVRDNYLLPDGRRALVATDRISAFDEPAGTLPLRGQILNLVSAWWFDQTADVAENHLLSIPDPNVTLALECRPLPVEMVVRAYLTGTTSTSIWVHYARGEREFCGHRLPPGLRQHDALPEPLLTPSTKAPKGQHDVSVSRADILRERQITTEEFDRIGQLSLALFRRGQEICERRGVILVDTKYEFGKTADGRIVVMDEIHTPDCSRFWDREDYATARRSGRHPESHDKDFVRRFLADQRELASAAGAPQLPDPVRVEASRRYLAIAERILGERLTLDLEEPVQRIARNLLAELAPSRLIAASSS